MSQYTTRLARYRGNPVIEILTDGDIFGAEFPYDERFRFGVQKASMILAAIDVIEDFAASKGRRPPVQSEIDVSSRILNLSCTCTKHDSFIRRGRRIVAPYLELTSQMAKIGFGLTKANAIVNVEDDIRRFVFAHF